MAFEFEKLSEVNELEEFPEGAKVLIEHDGNIKRCVADGLGGGGSSIPILVYEENESGNLVCALADGRTADEFAASFEKDGIVPALLICEHEAEGGFEQFSYWLASLTGKTYVPENAIGEYAALAGVTMYRYNDSRPYIILSNLNEETMAVLDHYEWFIED